MEMTELLPLKVYLSTLMKAVVYIQYRPVLSIIYTILLPCVTPLSIHDMAQQFFSDFSKSYVDKDIHKRVLKKPPY